MRPHVLCRANRPDGKVAECIESAAPVPTIASRWRGVADARGIAPADLRRPRTQHFLALASFRSVVSKPSVNQPLLLK